MAKSFDDLVNTKKEDDGVNLDEIKKSISDITSIAENLFKEKVEILETSNKTVDLLKTDIKNSDGKVIEIEKHVDNLASWFTIQKNINDGVHNKRIKATELHLLETINKNLKYDKFKLQIEKKQNYLDSLKTSLNKSVGCTASKATAIVDSISDFAIDKFTSVIKSSEVMVNSVSNFFQKYGEKTWDSIDSFMDLTLGSSWSIVKNLGTMILKPIKWLYSIGKTSFQYVYEGFKKILSPIVTVIKGSTLFLLKSPIYILEWWTKSLITTIFSPSMWLLNIPIFTAMTFGGLYILRLALLGANNTITPFLSNLLEKSFNILKGVGQWMWTGTKHIFEWIKLKWNESDIFRPFIENHFNNIKDMFFSFVGGSKPFITSVNWIKESWNWWKQTGQESYNWVLNQFNKIKESLGGKPYYSYLNSTLEVLSYFKIPIVSKYMRVLGKMQPGKEMELFEHNVENLEQRLYENLLQVQLDVFKKQNPMATIEEVDSHIKNNILPDISKFGVSADTDLAIYNAKRKSDQNRIVTLEEIKTQIATLKSSQLTLEKVKSGQLDLTEIIDETVFSQKLKNTNIDLNKKFNPSSQLFSLDDAYLFKNEIDYIPTMGRGSARSDIENFDRRVHDLKNKTPIPKYADGGIKPFNSNVKNIIPLNAVGIDYIRSKIKEIPDPNLKINLKENVLRNITIIEEDMQIVQSYETYTMESLAKGILGVS